MKVVLQRDETDCGVCCLQSIIRHYHGDVSLERLRLDAKTDMDGTTALNLVLASQKYGFDALGMRLDNLSELKNLPAIAHMNLKSGYSHYVVIEKITDKNVVLMDPAKGKVVKDIGSFKSEWSGVALLFYPVRKITILKQDITLFKIISSIFKSEKSLIKLIILTTLFITLFSIVLGYFFQVIESILNTYSLSHVKIIVCFFFVLTILKLALTYYKNHLKNHLNKNIDCILVSDFIKHLYNLPLNVLITRNSGEIMSRVQELFNLKEIILDLAIESILDVLLIVLTMPLLIRISAKLFLILFLICLLLLIVGIITKNSLYKKAYQNIEYETVMNNGILEDIKMMQSIKNLNIIKYSLGKLEKKLGNYFYDTYELNIFLNILTSIKTSINEIGIFLINTVGFYLVYKGEITLINLITFNMLYPLFLNPIERLINEIPRYSFVKASVSKVNDILSLEVEKLGSLEETYGYDLKFHGVSYSYNKITNTLDNVSFSILEGEFVHLRGKSGSGKSTICNILNKTLEDYEGNILLGALNYKDLSLETIRENITYVSQNEMIFSGTLKENLSLGKDVSLVDLECVSLIAGLDKFVSNQPFRYDTIISPSIISGGEKQRIILARALLNNFNILILDEALSEVDMKTEIKIIKNMQKYYKDKTVIYVSHKKYPHIFDRIINMEDL